MATSDFVKECDYLGIVSGNKEPDKIKKAGFTVCKSEFVDVPVINELPMVLECEVIKMSDSSDYIVGNIINVSADESILTDGKIDVAKLKPICYDPVSHNYNALGQIMEANLNKMWENTDWSMSCQGCHSENCGCKDCNAKQCISKKNLSNCKDCPEYPCIKATSADYRSMIHTEVHYKDEITWGILPYVPLQYE
jgi:hypothetical protein